jgi:hypothetical protein
MGKFDRFCQSCGMPMDQDPAKGGSNSDGTKSLTFCSYCYQDGKFNDDFKSSHEMVAFVKGKLKEMGYGPLKRWFYTSHISQLSRWKTQ